MKTLVSGWGLNAIQLSKPGAATTTFSRFSPALPFFLLLFPRLYRLRPDRRARPATMWTPPPQPAVMA
ncbi:uncharacterized [Tachysurus ichikawai]